MVDTFVSAFAIDSHAAKYRVMVSVLSAGPSMTDALEVLLLRFRFLVDVTETEAMLADCQTAAAGAHGLLVGWNQWHEGHGVVDGIAGAG